MSQGDVIGDFEIIREIGRGGMGVVYEARQVSLSRRVALKVLPGIGRSSVQAIERFRREAASAAKLTHPNIIQVYAFGESSGHHFIAMEFVDGPSFDRVLADGRCPGLADEAEATLALPAASDADARTLRVETKPLAAPPCQEAAARRKDLDRYLRILVETARALHAAHEVGVLHRDVKPANILIGSSGHVKLADFGLARRETAGDTVTASGEVLGTLAYMSPEQVASKRVPITRRADVYALGVTLYEVLSGKRPFDHPTAHVVMHQILTQEPPRPRRIDPTIPKDLEIICLKAMEKEAERRYATALEFAEDIERFLRDEPILARPASTLTRVVRFVRRRKVPVLATVALVGAAIVILALLQRDRAKDRLAREEAAARNRVVAREKVEASLMRSLGGEATTVLAMLDEAGRLDPDLVDVHLHRGLLFFNMDQPDKALAELDVGLSRHPGDPALQFARGTVLRFLGRTEEGIAALKSANLAMVTDHVRLTAIGMFQTTNGLAREALDTFDMAKRQNAAWPQSRFGLALANYRLRRFDRALEVLKTFLDLDPDNAVGYALFVAVSVGRGWYAEGEVREQIVDEAGEALARLRRRAGLDPLTLAVAASVQALDQSPGASARLASALDRVDQALQNASKERLQVSGGIVYELAALLAIPIDEARARRYAEAALAIRRGTDMARIALADLDARDGRLAEAAAAYRAVADDFPQAPVAPARLLALRVRRLDLVQEQDAVRYVRLIQATDTDDPDLLIAAAEAAAAIGALRAEAIELYKRAAAVFRLRGNDSRAAEFSSRAARLKS